MYGLARRRGDLDGDLAAIEASFGALRDVAAPARQPDERAGRLDRMWRLGE